MKLPRINRIKPRINFRISVVFITLITAIVSIILPFYIPHPVYAADFKMSIQRTFTVNEDQKTLHITEERAISNNSSTHYIPVTSEETFIIQNFKEGLSDEELDLKKNSAKITDIYGTNLDFSINQEGEDLYLKVNYPQSIRSGQSLTFIMEYDSNELIEKVGKVTNVYIPGLSSEYQEVLTDSASGTTTQVIYETSLQVPNSIQDETFTVPNPSETSSIPGYKVFKFDTDSILGKSVWHQIGSDQIFYFKLTQKSNQTDFMTPEQLNFLSKNKYRIILPREYSETNQKVFISRASPEIDSIEIDQEGNVLATYYLDATKTSEVTVEGYITTSLESDTDSNSNQSTDSNSTQDPNHTRNGIPTDKTLSDLEDYSEIDKYLKATEFWEVDSPEIQAKAEELAAGETNILNILKSDYSFIVDSIDYDDFKYGDRNTRKGALETLKGGDSVCMEYSDLLIALARAQGIPARAAYGYGFDPQQSREQQENHQWVQVWIPDYGWLSMDPTWGETGREFIGKDLDHALWYVAGEHPNTPSPLEVTSTNTEFELESSQIEITAIEEIPDTVELTELEDLIQKTPTEEGAIADFSRAVQTSMLGKALVVVGPICIGVVVLTVLISVVTKALSKAIRNRELKAKRHNKSQTFISDSTDTSGETSQQTTPEPPVPQGQTSVSQNDEISSTSQNS